MEERTEVTVCCYPLKSNKCLFWKFQTLWIEQERTGKRKHYRLKNKQIREITQDSIINKLENRQISWYDHITKMAPEILVTIKIETKNEKDKEREKAKKIWNKRIEELDTVLITDRFLASYTWLSSFLHFLIGCL